MSKEGPIKKRLAFEKKPKVQASPEQKPTQNRKLAFTKQPVLVQREQAVITQPTIVEPKQIVEVPKEKTIITPVKPIIVSPIQMVEKPKEQVFIATPIKLSITSPIEKSLEPKQPLIRRELPKLPVQPQNSESAPLIPPRSPMVKLKAPTLPPRDQLNVKTQPTSMPLPPPLPPVRKASAVSLENTSTVTPPPFQITDLQFAQGKARLKKVTTRESDPLAKGQSGPQAITPMLQVQATRTPNVSQQQRGGISMDELKARLDKQKNKL